MTDISSHDDASRDRVSSYLDEHRSELIAFRRHLHAHPELSGQEFETTEALVERLSAAVLNPVVLSSGTGLWCDIGEGERCVALRADIDGLAMDDTKQVTYRSRRPGVAHGCGHDMHTAIVLGAGLALSKASTNGRVRLIFEPAEETVPGGAPTVIADGGLDGVDAIFGLHCDPKLDVGQIGLRVGALTSAADMMEIVLHGPGGHTARPHLTVDLVSIAGRVASELSAVVAKSTDELLVVFGAIIAGNAANVIPTSALLRGSVRTPHRAVWHQAEHIINAALCEIVEGTEALAELRYTQGVPPVVNDPWAVSLVDSAAQQVLGKHAVVEAQQSAGGDTFAWYQERVPGCYARLGVHDPSWGESRLDLHSGAFDVGETSLDVGIKLLVQTALDSLAERPQDRTS